MASAILEEALPIETVADAMSERHLVAKLLPIRKVIKMRVLIVGRQ